MSMNLVKTVVGYMKSRPEEKFTARQLAEWVFAAYPAECAAKKAASSSITTDTQLVQQLMAEIGAQRPGLQKRHPEVKTTEGRPEGITTRPCPTAPRWRRPNMKSAVGIRRFRRKPDSPE